MKKLEQIGFTLLEVLIAMTILATLTLFAAQAIKQALVSKQKIQSQLDSMSQVRDTISLIQKDLQLAYHYLDVELEYLQSSQKQSEEIIKSNSDAPKTGVPDSSAQLIVKSKELFNAKMANRTSPQTHFVGTDEKLYFYTGNSLVPPQDPSSNENPYLEFVKVGYKVAPCPLKDDKKCLIRFSSTQLNQNIDEFPDGFTLLEDVTEFKLRYLGKNQQDWISSWNSIEGQETQKHRYPEAVEITLKVESEKEKQKKTISMQIITYLHFANNKEPSSSPSANGGSSPGSGNIRK